MSEQQFDIIKALSAALREVFSENGKSGRFIDVSRIPLICQHIAGIHDSLAEIKETLSKKVVTQDQFWPVKTLVYGFVALILVAVVGAIITLIINSPG